jgi:hypothetical protein
MIDMNLYLEMEKIYFYQKSKYIKNINMINMKMY